MSLTMYHNPRCSKSRTTLALQQERGHEPALVLYLKTPPTAKERTDVLRKLKIGPRALMRSSEPAFAELGLADDSLTDEALIGVMVANPIFIERPVLIAGDAAAIGRPPEAVLEIL
jgi:arsenate reductase